MTKMPGHYIHCVKEWLRCVSLGKKKKKRIRILSTRPSPMPRATDEHARLPFFCRGEQRAGEMRNE